MSKIIRTGFIQEVADTVKVGAKETLKQVIVLHVPGYEHQGYSYPDEHWQLDIIGPAIEKHQLNLFSVGERATVEFFVGSRKWEKEEKKMYIINCKLHSITWLPK